MSRSRRARWRLTMAVAGVGLVLVLALATQEFVALAVGLAIVLAVALWQLRPQHFGRADISHWAAQDRHVRDGTPIVYVRPGSVHCLMLRAALGRKVGRAVWVDIWADDEAAAFVRDINNGAETVPTVIMRAGDALTRPDPSLVLAELSDPAPADPLPGSATDQSRPGDAA